MRSSRFPGVAMKSSLLLLCAALSFSVPAGAAQVQKARLVAPPAHLQVLSQALDRFARDVAAGTEGRVQIERVAPGNPYALGARVAAGEAEIGQVYSSDLAGMVPAIQALELPYAFRDYDQALAFLDGARGRALLDGLAAHNLRGVAFTFSGGFKIIPTGGRELRRLEDFKGLRLWGYPGEVSAAMAESWGAVSKGQGPVAAVDETLAMIKKGELDGAEMTYPVLGRLCQDPAVKVVNETYHSLRATALVINAKFLASLSAADQKVLESAAREAAQAERLASIAEAESMRRSCQRAGVTIVSMTPAEADRMAQAAKPVYEKVKAKLGAELVSALQDGRVPAKAGPSR